MLEFLSPFKGKVYSIEDVPSETFSQRMMGDGFAIELDDTLVVAPFDGTIQVAFPTGHAVAIVSDSGVELLIHLGIDTYVVGEGVFKLLIEEGQKVTKGTPLVEVDLERLKANQACLISPLVFTSGQKVNLLKANQFVSALESSLIELV